MKRLHKKNIYLPSTLHTVFESYSNGYIIWLSGGKATLVKYLENKRKMPIELVMANSNIQIRQSLLRNSQSFYNIYHNHEERKTIQYYNLIHTQMKKAVLNAVAGIKKYLFVRGVGYKFITKNDYLTLQVGYSHRINIRLPSYIKTSLNRKSTKIKFLGNDLGMLSGMLSAIRKFKKPDVYKGKGIRYRRDNVIRKEGKKKKTF